nr:ATP-binding protein [Actinospica acidithermotolerans]
MPESTIVTVNDARHRHLPWRLTVTSNLPFGRWGETFSDDVVAAAMIDRLVHHAEVLTLTGDSYRTRQRRELLAKDNRAANG